MRIDCYPEAPLDWPRKTVGELAEIDPPYQLEVGQSYPFVEMGSVRESFGGIDLFDRRVWDRSGLCRFKENDLLLGKITPCAENGKAALVRGLPESFGIGSTEFFVLSPNEGVNPEFLFAAVTGGPFHRRLVSRMEGSTGRLRIKSDSLKKWLTLPVPPPDEQRRIAAALKLADEAIQKARAELDATPESKKSLLNELLEKGLPGRYSSFIETKRLFYPESWTLKKLKKCGTWSAGGTPDRENVGYYEGSIPWVKSGEVNYSVIVETEEHLSEDGAKQTTCGVLPVGTLLIAMYGAGVTRGRVALLGIQASTNQAVATFNGHEGVENEFVYYWFERNYERVRAWAAGSNQDNLSGYLLKNLQIALPDHDEQIEIVKWLKAADEATCAIQKRVDALMDVKRSLLQNLLAGKIRIPPSIPIDA